MLNVCRGPGDASTFWWHQDYMYKDFRNPIKNRGFNDSSDKNTVKKWLGEPETVFLRWYGNNNKTDDFW